MTENEIGTIIINNSIAIHKELGAGLFESVYTSILYHLLSEQNLRVEKQVLIPVRFRELWFDEVFRADLIVEQKVLVELKSVEHVLKVHKKQVLTYLKLTGLKLGYLINFNESLLKDGITRMINGRL